MQKIRFLACPFSSDLAQIQHSSFFWCIQLSESSHRHLKRWRCGRQLKSWCTELLTAADWERMFWYFWAMHSTSRPFWNSLMAWEPRNETNGHDQSVIVFGCINGVGEQTGGVRVVPRAQRGQRCAQIKRMLQYTVSRSWTIKSQFVPQKLRKGYAHCAIFA